MSRGKPLVGSCLAAFELPSWLGASEAALRSIKATRQSVTDMPGLLINIDVPDVQAAVGFYTAALELQVGRRFGDDFVELVGADVPLYLLQKDAGTSIGPAGGDRRRYDRQWSPIHPDFVVPDLDAAVARATSAGAVQEGENCEAPYGRLAMFADPFGHGFCLIEFNKRGYDALADHGG